MKLIIVQADRYEELIGNLYTALSEASASTTLTENVVEGKKSLTYELDITELRALKYRLDRVMDHLDR